VTLLEINTAVHVACAMGIYGFMWFKPQGATEALVIDVSKCATCERFIMENKSCLVSATDNMKAPWHDEFNDVKLGALTLISLAVIYGGLHAAAWDAHFPSYVEQILWRVSVLTIIVSSAMYLLTLLDVSSEGATLYVWLFLPALVFLPRLYLVIEAFISVRSLPVGAYQTVDWVEFLPHIG